MIIVAGSFRIPRERVDELLPAARAMVEETLKEAGCIVFSFALDVHDGTMLRIYEEWESRSHLEAHGRQKHVAAWRAKLGEVGISGRKLTAFEAGTSWAL